MPPNGPYAIARLERVVEGLGWAREREPEPDEVAIYRHPRKAHPLPINPDWPPLYKDDPNFSCIRRDLGLSSHRLLVLLSQH